ncbi:MAG: MerR family transcriptional regulator [Streptosporangiaceae bacterium]|nr:MerR family transcriptional regulator [Streptosporangiaceae bacterium]
MRMQMAELSRRSMVPVATIKYYQREGLLQPGTPTAATRAEYGEQHLRRLRLIRALVEIGEVPVAAIRHVLAMVDDESVSLHDMFGAVQYSLGPQPGRPSLDPDGQAARREVDELIDEMGWKVSPDAPARELLASALAALHRADAARGPSLRTYASAMAALAAREVPSVTSAADGKSRVELAESAVAAMVLHERVIVALRRLAQEDASAKFFAGRSAY